MIKDDKNRMMMLSLSGYEQVLSITNLISVGRNIERVNYEEYFDKLESGELTEIDALLNFIKDYHETVISSNDISDLSIKFVKEQSDMMNYFLEKFADIVLGSTGDDPILSKQITNVEKFRKYLQINQEMINATSYLIYNTRDVFTVSTITMMEIYEILGLNDETMKYDVLNIIGRRNETKSSDVDPWLESIEYDYELFHIKRILDSVLDIIAISPQLLTHLIIYQSLMTAEFVDSFNLLDEDVKIDDNKIDDITTAMLEIVKNSLESVVDIMNKKKYAIAPYYTEIFDGELTRLPFVKINPSYDSVNVPDSIDGEETFLVKIYELYTDDNAFKNYIENKVREYLGLAGYFDKK